MEIAPKIYLVDDDAFFLQLLQMQLNDVVSNAEIKTFTSGENLVEALQNEKPDLIVLDYFLDKENPYAMDGSQTLDKIKSINSEQKVIMLSGQDNFKVVDHLFEQGVFDYVIKDEFAFNTLKEKIKKMI